MMDSKIIRISFLLPREGFLEAADGKPTED
jgi:hypothetical protein